GWRAGAAIRRDRLDLAFRYLSASPSPPPPLWHLTTFSVPMPQPAFRCFIIRIKAQDLERTGAWTPLDWVHQLPS
ncbi:TPA: hypothetical protein ACYLK7_006831, partial [Burkholderia cenocepacia]